MRRNVRKRSGNIATGMYLSLNGESIAILWNIAISEYWKSVFGADGIAPRFAAYWKKVKNTGTPRRIVIDIVVKGKTILYPES